MNVKNRHHLRSDAVSDLVESIEDHLGVTVEGDTFESVELIDSEFDVVLVDGEPYVMYVDDEPFLTVQGANAFPPTKRLVTVDTGAISFVSDGADVMRPGIVEADDVIDAGDLVCIDEEAHGKVLAVGRALVDGDDMVGDSGKVVESVHFVGDELFQFSV